MSFRANTLLRSAIRAQPKATPSRLIAKRAFATGESKVPPPSPGAVHASKTPYFLGGLGLVLVGGAYYFFQPGVSTKDQGKKIDTAVRSAAASAEGKLGLRRGKEDYLQVYNRIAELLDAEDGDDYDDGSYGPVFVRLAWHSSGTYCAETKTGGSNYATMRFHPESAHGANNGLNLARERIERVKKEFPWISYGDLWTLGGVAAIQEMAGPKIPWRPGRIDGFETDATPDGRLPDASLAHDHLRQIFYRMGFNDAEIVALSGAHALGRCHTNRSGFEGPWTFSPTTFTNDYYKLLFDEKWSWRKWAGPKQYEDNKTKTLMMLPTDMAIVKDKSFRKTAMAYAKDEQLFFKDFSNVFAKLLELGVPTSQWAGEPWILPSRDDQEDDKKTSK